MRTTVTAFWALLTVLLFALVTCAVPVTATEPDPPPHDGRSYEPRFTWPLHPEPEVVRPFDPPERAYGDGHRGVDLGAAPGDAVYAAGEGVVLFAGRLAGRGVVSIDHDTLRTTYEPLQPAVTPGDQVYAGQRIGTVTAGHRGCDPACLHWGVRRGDPPEYLNPLRLVASSMRLRLKPWE